MSTSDATVPSGNGAEPRAEGSPLTQARVKQALDAILDLQEGWPDETSAGLLGDFEQPKGSRFVQWLAGANPVVLAQVPWEGTKFSKLGTALLVPPILGWVGLTVTLHMTLGRKSFDEWLAIGSLPWIFLVIAVDRMLISTRVDYQVTELDDGSVELTEQTPSRSRTLLVVTRVVLALALGVTTGEPLLAALFGSEAVELANEKAQDEYLAKVERLQKKTTSAARDQADADSAERERLEAEIRELTAGMTSVRAAYDSAQRSCSASPRSAVCGEPLTVARDSLGLVIAHNQPKIDSAQGDLKDLGERATAAGNAFTGAIEAIPVPKELTLSQLGAWKRIELTNQLLPWWQKGALMALLMCLDCLAILGKALVGRTAHDELLSMASGVAAYRWQDRLLEDVERVHTRRRVRRAAFQQVADDLRGPARFDNTARAVRYERDVASGDRHHDDNGSSGGNEPASLLPLAVNAIAMRYRTEPLASGGFADVHDAYMVSNRLEPWMADSDLVVKLARAGAEDQLAAEVKWYLQYREALHVVLPRNYPLRDDERSALVMEKQPRLSLDLFLDGPGRARRDELEVRIVIAWFRNLIDHLENVWKLGLVHGDGKPANILVTGRLDDPMVEFPSSTPAFGNAGSLLLCDMSTCQALDSPVIAFTRGYTPPTYNRLSFAGDVYSFLGCVGWFLLTGHHPQHSLKVTTRPSAVHLNPMLAEVPALVAVVEDWMDMDYLRSLPADAAGLAVDLRAAVQRVDTDLASVAHRRIMTGEES
jgi:hypothetical protein